MVWRSSLPLAVHSRPLVVRFNPWWFSRQGNLTDAFFEELGKALVSGAGIREATLLGTAVRRYPRYLKVTAHVADITSELLIAITLLLGTAITLVPVSGWRRLTLAAVLAILVVSARGFSLAQRLAEKTAGLIEAIANKPPMTVADRKKQLASLLAKCPTNIVVVLDDVDRLTTFEVREILQLVKANADFPRLVYLVLCERRAIEAAITHDAPQPGREFLAKIFQVTFDLPLPHPRQITALLADRLDRLLDEFGALTFADRNRWIDLLTDGLLPYIRTIRDVNRFVSTLDFQIGLRRIGNTLEVNKLDLIALETLRVFEPDVYSLLPARKDTLLQDYDSPLIRDDDRTLARSELHELESLASPDRRRALRHILLWLFPHLARVYNDRRASRDEGEWVRSQRVCSGTYFDRYFAHALRADELSESEVEYVRSHMEDSEGLLARLDDLSRRGLISEMFTRLEAHKTTLPLTHAESFVSALFAYGDHLKLAPIGFGMDSEMSVVRVIHWFLIRMEDVDARSSVFASAIERSGAVLIPLIMCHMENDARAKGGRLSDNLVADARLVEITTRCRDVVRAAASASRLSQHPRLARCVFYWKEIDEENARAWIAALVGSPSGALALLRSLVQKGHSHTAGDRLGRLHVRVFLKEIESLVDLDVFHASLQTARSQELTSEDQEALGAYDRATKRRAKGHSDEMRLDDTDAAE